ncbi:MAG: GNAT family N-acetyltransferase [Actinomycetota bacterium]
MGIVVRPLTPERWPALEDLLSESGAVSRCWCMYWRIGARYRQVPADQNREAFRGIVQQGPPPGLLGFTDDTDDTAIGWCQITPREAAPAVERIWRLKPVDDLPVWAITCLFVRKGYRRQGVTSVLIAEALALASNAGAPAVEAYPVDSAVSPSATGTGYASTFERAGFTVIARRTPSRPIMRYELSDRSVRP